MTAAKCLCISKQNGDLAAARNCLPEDNLGQPVNQHVPYPDNTELGATMSIQEMYQTNYVLTTDNFNEIIVKLGSRQKTTATQSGPIGRAFVYPDHLNSGFPLYDVGIVIFQYQLFTYTPTPVYDQHSVFADQYIGAICLPKRL